MRYLSTRGQTPEVSFDDAIQCGQAPDGGLFVPETIPSLSEPNILDGGDLAELACRIFPAWIGRSVSRELAGDAFSMPIPITHLGERAAAYKGIHVVELFHGPTESFKDFGARFLARWFSSLPHTSEKQRIVLVATSGDTGSAVADGFSGQAGTSVVVLYPCEGVSRYQRAQLTKPRPGVYPFAVRGSFDDCQRSVKEAFLDAELSHVGLTSANSINIGRLVPQMLFYLWSAGKVGAKEPLFVVPSGNLGNLCAGMMAARSAIPRARFIAANNQNRFFVDYLAAAEAVPGAVVPSLSNAMDVTVPSNLERMIYLFGREGIRQMVTGTSVTDEETCRTMTTIHSDTGYVADPHTAVGLTAALRLRGSEDDPVLVMGTAHPAKYSELVLKTTGVEVGRHEDDEPRPDENIIEPGLRALRPIILDIVERDMP